MNFNSLSYLILLSATVLLYFNLPPRGRKFLLFASSVIFYSFWSVPLLSLIFITAGVDFFAGLMIERSRTVWQRRLALLTSLSVNLGILGYFKYANFFMENFHLLLGESAAAQMVKVALPPGISFYTFQSMSYTIDVFTGRLKPTHSITKFFQYVCFFPQLVAGPIERAGHLMSQFDFASRHRFSPENFTSGLRMIVLGMFKKVIIADYCALLADPVYNNPGAYDGWSAIIATYAFTIQIYADFSAYSEIARGSARLFGIDLMKNFDQPYLSTDVGQFWRRWHISLSTWIRDYLFIPLGGSQRGRARTLVNLLITMFLSGLWHGAAWNFILWGLYHGFLLLIQTVVTRHPAYADLRRRGGAIWNAAAWFATFHSVVFGWILFRMHSVHDGRIIVGRIVEALVSLAAPSPEQILFLFFVAGFLVVQHLIRRGKLLDLIDRDLGYSTGFYALQVVLIALFVRSGGSEFIYFQF